MSGSIGVWQVREGIPVWLVGSTVSLERDLETWIETQPQLVQADLKIVGRQVKTEAGRLDLLGLDMQGRWVVVEVKRDRLTRDAVAQALDYACCVRVMPLAALKERVRAYLSAGSPVETDPLDALVQERPDVFDEEADTRDVDIILVGMGRDPSLTRVCGMLAAQGQLSVRAVQFEMFELGSGERVLVRELTDSDREETPTQVRQAAWSREALLERARQNGLYDDFAKLIGAADELGLHKRITNRSVMLAPPADRRRCLLVSYADKPFQPGGGLATYIPAEGLGEFYDVDEAELQRLLGPVATWRGLGGAELDRFLVGLREIVSNPR
ncbi:hypothetical protein LCGC14_1273910 [marine sediment metagenome]|uniref:Endonuclease NucS C-terminal domain-containing protein n=1 Tax=marine sediment metagenome TaxID=412755 RepID=A0A0F9KX99_9ZZZZ